MSINIINDQELREFKVLIKHLAIELKKHPSKNVIPITKILNLRLEQLTNNKTILFQIDRENYSSIVEYKNIKGGIMLYEFKRIYLPDKAKIERDYLVIGKGYKDLKSNDSKPEKTKLKGDFK